MLPFMIIFCLLFQFSWSHPIPMRLPIGNNATIQVRTREVNCDDPQQRNKRNLEICVVDPKACFNCIPKRSCGSMCVEQHVSCGHACPEKATNQVEYHPVEVTHQTVVDHDDSPHCEGDSCGHDGDSDVHYGDSFGHIAGGDSVGHPIGDTFAPEGDSYGHFNGNSYEHGAEPVGHAVGDSYVHHDGDSVGRVVGDSYVHHDGDTVGHVVGDSYVHHDGDSVGHVIGDSYVHHEGDSVGHPIGDSYGHDGISYDHVVHNVPHHEDVTSEYEATHYGNRPDATYQHIAVTHGDNLLNSVDTAYGHHLAAHVDTVQPQVHNLPLNTHEVVAPTVHESPYGTHMVSPGTNVVSPYDTQVVAPAPSNVVLAHNGGTVLTSHATMLTHNGVNAGIVMPPHGDIASSPNCPCNCPATSGTLDLPKVIGIENVQYSYNTGRKVDCSGECASVDPNTPATCSHECCP